MDIIEFELLGQASLWSLLESVTLTSDQPPLHPGAGADSARASGTHRGRARRMSVVTVQDSAALRDWESEWENLAGAAIEPNVFYEPWMLFPAVDAFGKRRELLFVLVFATPARATQGKPLLCGFFPLERLGRRWDLPVPRVALWKYLRCHLCTPLLRAGYVPECLEAFFKWARSDRAGAPVVQLSQVAGDGVFKKHLVDCLYKRSRPAFIYGTFNRGLLVTAQSAAAYLESTLSRKALKESRRMMERMSGLGSLRFTSLPPDGDLDAWVGQFLALEESGWKGRAASAPASTRQEREYFVTITREAFRRQRLMMLGMELNGRPVAMMCNLLAGEGSFAFKIAFDENYTRFSPVALLELENIDRLHQTHRVRWMDSCAGSEEGLISSLWTDRRTIQTFAIATGRPMGDFVVSAMPLMRWIARKAGRRAPRAFHSRNARAAPPGVEEER